MSGPTAQDLFIFLLLSILTLSTSIVCVNCEEEDGEEWFPKLAKLEIHNTFKPELCDRKTKVFDMVTLNYKGTLQDGKVFDSSYDRGEPFTFQLGIAQVIEGWEKGLLDACVGEKRRLVIPPHLGYGDNKHEVIPPQSTLTFEVEILKIEDGPKPVNVFKEIDADSDNRLTREEVAGFLKKQLHEASQSQHGDLGSAEDPEQTQMVDEIFMHEDRDKDGYITHDEFSGPKHDHDEL